MADVIGRDVFVKLTDPTGRHKPVITRHRVWDADLFMASLVKRYDTDAEPEDRRLVSRSTAAEYRQHN